MKHKKCPIILLILLDIIGIGIGLCIFALFHHVLPKDYQADTSELIYTGKPTATAEPEVSTEPTVTGEPTATAEPEVSTEPTVTGEPTATAEPTISLIPTPTPTTVDYGDFGSSFPAVFTDGEVISTDTVYQSENVSVTTTTYSTDNLTFYVQDIYIKNIENFKTAFAKDTYGKSIAEWSLTIAISHNAIASINGDYYGIHGDGIVIRNGYVYRNVKDDNDDVCVIYWDGTMKVISAQNFDIEQVIADGAYQAWSFGPGLLNDDGSAKTNFNSSIAKANPRSAIGYYEPGHYCFVAVDGRNENGSNGATLVLLAQIMESLDCSVAYNLDGGKSSAMTFGDELVNTPCDGGREDTDIIYIAE